MNRFKKGMSVFAGTLSLGLGIIGIILPILPTTPFFLLTLFLYTHGSDRFKDWFVNTKLYDAYLKEYVDNKQMSVSTKIRIIIFVTLSLSIGIYFVDLIPVRILLLSIMLFHYYAIIFRIPTSTKGDDGDFND